MSTADTTTKAFADTRPSDVADVPEYAPIPRSALGPARNEHGDHDAVTAATAEPVIETYTGRMAVASSGIRRFTPHRARWT